MPKTVVLLNPYGGDVTAFVNGTPLIPQLLMGTVMQSGDTLYTLPYINLIATAANITAAEALLNTKLLALAAASSQPILVFAYSMGCEVADKWITDNAAGVPVPAGQLSFLSIANANSKYGGCFQGRSNYNAIGFTGGLPATVPWAYTIFSRQYDPIGDFPQDPAIGTAFSNLALAVTTSPTWFSAAFTQLSNLFTNTARAEAVENGLAGLYLCHLDYLYVTPNDPGNLSYTD